ncbi:MAG: PIG-L family deacetylase [Planctomycetes bacterium]|nr:PIG-L family deacetylase [Planctomycetota bacterium]
MLVFAPHPDDEAAGPGGSLALHRQQGDPVRVVVVTDGRNGDAERQHEPAAYAALRAEESRRGLAELGVDDVVFWGLPDGHVPSEADLAAAVARAVAELACFRPDVVYLPWSQEGHPDHHAVHQLGMRALAAAGFRGLCLGYEIWNALLPDVVVDIGPVIERKAAAMRAHRSQLALVRFDRSLLGLAEYRSLVHLQGKGHGEAFAILGGTWPDASDGVR